MQPFLPRPTADEVIRAQETFNEENGPIEWILKQLFEKFPENTDFGEVVVKTKVLNVLYSTQIRAVNIVARHICSIAIDADLKAGNPEIVDGIAKVQLSDKIRNNLRWQRRGVSLVLQKTRWLRHLRSRRLWKPRAMETQGQTTRSPLAEQLRSQVTLDR